MPSAAVRGTLATMADASDREILERCRRGPDEVARAAFRELYDRHFADVYRFAHRILGDADAAEDAAQETFVRLHRSLASVDPARALRPLVLTIAKNVAVDALRARAKRPKNVPEVEATAPPKARGASAVEKDAADEERRACVRAALDALAPEHRTILILRHVDGLKLEAIAEGASCTVRTARNRLRAAASLLGRELERRGLVPGEELP